MSRRWKYGLKNCVITTTLALALAMVADRVDAASDHPDAAVRHHRSDAAGPDLSLDAERLRASIEVVHNATVSSGDVAEGCAEATTGRSLVRFDMKTDNLGPGDLFLGAVSCTSTRRGSCSGQDCQTSPECCTDHGDYQCENEAGFDAFFEYDHTHEHIHFSSFANYRILNADRTVARRGHKQSFCLLDSESINGSTCESVDLFSCGYQGIHAGCADVYSAGLPCQYVDVTGLQPDHYLLEITLDPENAFAESNEANNTVVVPFALTDAPPPPDLVCSGVPSNARYCISSPTPLPDNVDLTTTWTPCGGGGAFTYRGTIDFEPNFDYIEIGDARFDGNNAAIMGCSAGTTTVSMFTDGSVSSRGIETLTATCTEGGSYQAESAQVGGGATVDVNHNGFTGSGFVNYPRHGGFVQWRHVQGGSGGQVLVAFRYALGVDTPRTAELIVNGDIQAITFEPTGGWNRWRHRFTPVNLRAGTDNTIALYSVGQDSGNIDELVMGLQAEDALVGRGSRVESNHNGFRGTGFVNVSRDGGFVEWPSVDGRNGGQARLTFRYALGADVPRTARLIVNGEAQPITFEPTGSWTQWRTTSKTVTLVACPPNSVRIESAGSDAGNIDQLFVTR